MGKILDAIVTQKRGDLVLNGNCPRCMAMWRVFLKACEGRPAEYEVWRPRNLVGRKKEYQPSKTG
jgi:hypothetical protein